MIKPCRWLHKTYQIFLKLWGNIVSFQIKFFFLNINHDITNKIINDKYINNYRTTELEIVKN